MEDETVDSGEIGEVFYPEIVMVNSWYEKVKIFSLCRICANTSDCLIPIFEGEGVQQELSAKINMHLPLKVIEDDKLPKNICYPCASTLIAWHDMSLSCLETDEKLHELIGIPDESGDEESKDKSISELSVVSDEEVSEAESNEMSADSQAKAESLDVSMSVDDDEDDDDDSEVTLENKQSTEDGNKSSSPFSMFHNASKKTGNRNITSKSHKDDENVQDSKMEFKSRQEFSDNFGSVNGMKKARKKLARDIVFVCTICRAKYHNKSAVLKHHITDHTAVERTEVMLKETDTTGKFKCNKCGKLYRRKKDLLRHQQKKFSGGSCINIMLEQLDEEIVKAAEVVVDGKTVYHCNSCDKNIMTKRGFVRHYRIHTDERPLTCHVCTKKYRTSAELSRHLRCVHEGIKNYPCDLCGRSFANKNTMQDHRRTHTGEKPYICKDCGKAFPTSNSIYVHRRIHTNYFPHQCPTCSKLFRRQQQLQQHIRTHTGEKPFPCEICGKCFGVKEMLSRHRLTHSNEKPFSCEECGVRFAQKRYLKNHTTLYHKTVSDKKK